MTIHTPYVLLGRQLVPLPTPEQLQWAARAGLYAACQLGVCQSDHTCASTPHSRPGAESGANSTTAPSSH